VNFYRNLYSKKIFKPYAQLNFAYGKWNSYGVYHGGILPLSYEYYYHKNILSVQYGLGLDCNLGKRLVFSIGMTTEKPLHEKVIAASDNTKHFAFSSDLKLAYKFHKSHKNNKLIELKK
jgi:hypothetical protein